MCGGTFFFFFLKISSKVYSLSVTQKSWNILELLLVAIYKIECGSKEVAFPGLKRKYDHAGARTY